MQPPLSLNHYYLSVDLNRSTHLSTHVPTEYSPSPETAVKYGNLEGFTSNWKRNLEAAYPKDG